MYGPNRLGLLPSTQACLELPDGVARPASEQQRMLFDREWCMQTLKPTTANTDSPPNTTALITSGCGLNMEQTRTVLSINGPNHLGGCGLIHIRAVFVRGAHGLPVHVP